MRTEDGLRKLVEDDNALLKANEVVNFIVKQKIHTPAAEEVLVKIFEKYDYVIDPDKERYIFFDYP